MAMNSSYFHHTNTCSNVILLQAKLVSANLYGELTPRDEIHGIRKNKCICSTTRTTTTTHRLKPTVYLWFKSNFFLLSFIHDSVHTNKIYELNHSSVRRTITSEENLQIFLNRFRYKFPYTKKYIFLALVMHT